jgi:hypothetical protein
MKCRALIPPFFLDCVVAIGVVVSTTVVTETKTAPKVETRWTASGFLYCDFVENIDEKKTSWYRVYLVTNRHVLENKKLVHLRFNPTDKNPAQEIPLPLHKADGSLDWTAHPDPNIDVAVVRVSTQFLKAQGIHFSVSRATPT